MPWVDWGFFHGFIQTLILWFRKFKPAAALTDSISIDSFKSVTPQDQFDELLENEDYEEALKVAKKFSLDTDGVYKKKWLKSRVSTDSIKLLKPVNDHDWVIEQCILSIPSDIQANRELLQFGLSLVDQLLVSLVNKKDSVDNGDDAKENSIENDSVINQSEDEDEVEEISSSLDSSASESSVCEDSEWSDLSRIDFSCLSDEHENLLTYRYLFLKYILRLNSYTKTLSANSKEIGFINPDSWKQFRSRSILEILLDLAHKGEWRSIKVILSRHESETNGHWLPILSNIPETLQPSLYQDLLPHVEIVTGQVYPSFKQQLTKREIEEMHWCQTLNEKLHFERDSSIFVQNFYERNPFLSDFRRETLNSSVLSSWFLVRAREIEVRSSLVSNAIELLELGIDRNVPDLLSFKDDLDTYATLVYQCFPMYKIDDIGFSEFERLSKEERINLLMLGATEDENCFLDCLNRFLLPYLRKTTQNSAEEKDLLWDFIVSSAKHNLNIVQKIFVDYKMSRELGSDSGRGIVKSDEDSIDYGMQCIYANERTDQLDAAFNIVETFPEPDSQFFLLDKRRNEQVIRLYKRLEVAELLEQYNHYITVQRLDDLISSADVTSIKAILNKVTREFCRKVDVATLKEQDWLQFLKDLERMRNACFSELIALPDIYEVFIKGILTSGRLEHFKFTANFMQLDPDSPQQRLMPYTKSVETIVEAAQHYLNSANSVKDEIIETAKKCLTLLDDEVSAKEPLIQREKDFIEALSILKNDFDFTILPIQIRLMEDSKIELIHQIISSRPKVYKKTNELLRLSKILNVFGSDELSSVSREEWIEVKLYTILGNVAYQRNDYTHCWSLCKIIMDKNYSSGWRLCELLGNCSSFTNNYSRLKLLSFTLIHCEDDLVFEILGSIKRLKSSLIEESLNCLNSYSSPSSDLPELSYLPSTLSSLSSTSASLLSSLPTIEITSKMIKSVKSRLAESQRRKNHHQPEGDEDIDNNEDRDFTKIKRRDSVRTINSLKISPFYVDAFGKNSHFNFEMNASDYSYLGFGDLYSSQLNLDLSHLQIRLRAEMLKTSINWETVSSLCLQLSQHQLPLDTLLALSSLLPLAKGNSVDIELPFKQFSPKTPALIFTALYFYSLLVNLKEAIYQRTVNGKEIWLENLTIEPMSSILTKADQICKQSHTNGAGYLASKEKSLVEEYFEMYCNLIQSDTITSLDPSVDVERFACETDYRQDTLLGLAMTTDDKIFNVVISLGKQYSVPLVDLYLTHLEFLLTDPTNDVEMIADRLFKRDDFVSLLKDNSSALEEYFEKRIFPLVAPDDHNRLVLCYQIIEKFCYQQIDGSPESEPNSNTTERPEMDTHEPEISLM